MIMNTNQVIRRFWLLACGLFVAGMGWAAPQTGVDWNNPVFTEDYVPGELLVGFKKNAKVADIAALHQKASAKVVRQFHITPAAHVRLAPKMSMAQAARQYLANPSVAYVEPNYIVRPVETIPDDPRYDELWGMERIRAPEAWDVAQGSHDIVVGVIDTGIFMQHPDLINNLAPGGYDFANNTANLEDTHGHGTHVAGTIGAVADNGIGVAGVNWQVKMVGLKFLDPSGTTANAIRAVEYAATNTALKIKITNNSWGGGGYSQGLYDAIKKAGEEYGQLFIAAAGNDGLDNDAEPHYPSSYELPNLIAVAAIADDGTLADFSNYGTNSVDLAAPGVDILSTVPGGSGQYKAYSGTSMACPHVAGAAALLWSINPNSTPEAIRNVLLQNVAANPELEGKVATGGELDLFAAVSALGPQIQLNRRAYRSDAEVGVTINDPGLTDPLPPEIEAALEVRDPAGTIRWEEVLALPWLTGNTYSNSFTLESGVTAVEDDLLTVVYESPGGKSATVSVPIDDTPPVLTGIELVNVSDEMATFTWRTDEPADTRFIISTNVPVGGLSSLQEEGGGIFVEDPVVENGLTQYVHVVTVPVEAARRYYVAMLSEDFAGNKGTVPANLASENPDDYFMVNSLHRRLAYVNDMESGPAGWVVSNRNDITCWQYGIPTYGPPGAHSGAHAWGTLLDANYPHLANASVASTPVAVQWYPRLTFWSWHKFAPGDFGVVEVNAGAGWVNVTSSSSRFDNYVEGTSDGWQEVVVDLTEFANQTIRVRFRMESNDEGTSAGWYIDDFRLTHVQPPGINIIGYEIVDAAGGDGDGYPEPGETFFLDLEIYNSTQDQTFGDVQATVTEESPAVDLMPAITSVAYGNMEPGDKLFSGSQIRLSTLPDVVLGTEFTVFHSATAAGGLGPFADTLTLEIVKRESVSGRVTDLFTGNPIPDATIRGIAAGHPALAATSAVDGTYVLHGFVPGVAYDIVALKPGEYSPGDPLTRTGPDINVNFALGRAEANPNPTTFDWEVNEGEGISANLDLDNSTGNIPLEYRLEVECLPHSTMSELPKWLAVEPAAGSIAAGDMVSIELTADSADLGASVEPYEAILRLISNDVGGEDIEVPVSFLVVASPVLYVQGVRIVGGDGDPLPEAGETLDLDIRLGNSGSLFALDLNGELEHTAGMATVLQPDAYWLWVLPGGAESPYVDPPMFELPRIELDPTLSPGDIVPFDLTVIDYEGREATLEFALTVTVRHAISGRVYDLDTDDPVAGAAVQAEGESGVVQALTDASGDYALYGLVNGTYEVSVMPPAPYGAPPSREITIASADQNNVNFGVAPWQVSVIPEEINVTLAESTGTNLELRIHNDGPHDGFITLDLELTRGIPHSLVGEPELLNIDWAALPADQVVPQELLVRFEDGSDLQAQASALTAVGAKVIRRFTGVPAACIRVPGNLSMEWVADTLTADSSIRYVEPNYRLEFHAVPNDPLYPQLYGLDNSRQTDGTLGADIRAPEAWETTVGGTGVVVAVLDTGVKLDHVDLAANLVPGFDFGMMDDDPNPDPVFSSEHGTHVAGTIGAVGNNDIGVSGVNWNSKVMPLKIADIVTNLFGIEEAGLSMDAALAGLQYAVTNGVKISNHSYGGIYYSGLHYEMIRFALSNDHLVVVSAGNSGQSNDDSAPTPQYPASYNLDNILSVAATDHDDQLAYFSNYGATSVDIAAPGVDILSTYFFGDQDAYEVLSGTSMAAPHVAGVAGLLKSIAPWATYAMLRDAILMGARPDAALEGLVASSGHLDAAGALEKIQAFWLQVDPMKGNLASGGTMAVQVGINLDGRLPAGTYQADIVIQGGANHLVVPVTVTVEPAPCPVIQEVVIDDQATGDGDGFAEPGETVELLIRLRNDGSMLYLAPSGVLGTATPGVVLVDSHATWPGIASGDVQANSTRLCVQMPGTVGDADFTLILSHSEYGPWSLPFTITAARRHTISGTVRDAQTTTGLGNRAVEYWGADSGRVHTQPDGSYRIDGLENGTYRFRVLGGQEYETSVVQQRTVAGGDSTADFVLRRPDTSARAVQTNTLVTKTNLVAGVETKVVTNIFWGAGQNASQLRLAAQTGLAVEQDLVLKNTNGHAFEFQILAAGPRRIGLISDQDALAGLEDVLGQMGWEVSLWTNNLVMVEDVLTGQYSTDEEVVLTQDLLILDLGGRAGTGRLLSLAEETLLKTYLDLGGKLIVTGGNVLSRPDDRRLLGLVGADSLDRAENASNMALLEQALSIDTNWVTILAGDRVAVAPMAYDQAAPDAEVAPAVYFTADGAGKIMRRETDAGGVVILWNGNPDGREWQEAGIWQDLLQGVIESELLEPAPWLDASPGSGSLANSELPLSIRADSAGLTIGEHHALLVVRGNYPGGKAKSIPVVFNVTQPTLRALSTTGVTNWMGDFIAGTGGEDASLFQFLYAGPDGVVQPPLPDGSATGDDIVLKTFPFDRAHGRFGVGFEWLPDLGRFDEVFHHDLIDTVPVRNVYVRAWDALTFEDSVAYGDSSVHRLSLVADEVHDFGTWGVSRVLGYPGPLASLRDSNGDSVPDGYYIRNGMDPRLPIGPLTDSWIQQKAVGTYGSAANQFKFPVRLFLADEQVFVLDKGNQRISVWTSDLSNPIHTYGTSGTGAGQFSAPEGMGKAPNANRFAVADTANHRIQVFTFTSAGDIAFERQFGSYGTGNGQFINPFDVAIDPLGRFYVADRDNHRVQAFDAGGNWLFTFGAFGTTDGQMKSPSGIAVDGAGFVHVADTGNNRIQVFTGGGVFRWKAGTGGTGAGQFNKPLSVQFGLGNRLVVSDSSNYRIQVLNSSGGPVGSLGQQGSGDEQLNVPQDAAQDGNSGLLFVADTRNHRILLMDARLDGDGDGMDDSWEIRNGLNPEDPADALIDSDGDGLLNIGEYRIQSDPHRRDTDNDGAEDGWEVAMGTQPGDAGSVPGTVAVEIMTSGAGLAFGWPVKAGTSYAVQATSNLVSGAWTTLPGSAFTAGADGTVVYTNANPSASRLYFRPVKNP